MGKRNYSVKVAGTAYKYVTEKKKKDRPADCTDTFFEAKMSIGKLTLSIESLTARGAAKALDLKLISLGRETVNVLLVPKKENHA